MTHTFTIFLLYLLFTIYSLYLAGITKDGASDFAGVLYTVSLINAIYQLFLYIAESQRYVDSWLTYICLGFIAMACFYIHADHKFHEEWEDNDD